MANVVPTLVATGFTVTPGESLVEESPISDVLSGWFVVAVNGSGTPFDTAGNTYSLLDSHGNIKVYLATISNPVFLATDLLKCNCWGFVWWQISGLNGGDPTGATIRFSRTQTGGGSYGIGTTPARYPFRTALLASAWNTINPLAASNYSQPGDFFGAAGGGGLSGHFVTGGWGGATGVCGNYSPTVGALNATVDSLLIEFVNEDMEEAYECPGYVDDLPDDDPGDLGNGCDILISHEGGIYVAWREGRTAKVRYSFSAWRSGTTTTVDVDTSVSTSCVPTLCQDQHGTLWCWVHNNANEAKCYQSVDAGATWTLYKTIPAACKWPQAVYDPANGNAYLCYHNVITGLIIEVSTAYWFSLVPMVSFEREFATRRPAWLRLDRHHLLHAYYRSIGGFPVHQYLSAPEADEFSTGTAVTTLSEALETPSVSLGTVRGIMAGWSGSTLKILRTGPEYDEQDGAMITWSGSPSITPAPNQSVGIAWDHRDTLWMALKEEHTAALFVYYSKNDGTTWTQA